MVKTKRPVKLKAAKEATQRYGCTECPRRFTRKGDMYRHMRSHTGEKPFSCPECADEFSRKDDMVRHLRTHTGLKPFTCAYCDRKFSRRPDMFKHMATHAGAKVKVECCPTCGCHGSGHGHKATGNSKNPRCGRRKQLVLHKCSLCSKAFGRKRDLTRHLRTHNLMDIVNLAVHEKGATIKINLATNKENESHHENVRVPKEQHQENAQVVKELHQEKVQASNAQQDENVQASNAQQDENAQASNAQQDENVQASNALQHANAQASNEQHHDTVEAALEQVFVQELPQSLLFHQSSQTEPPGLDCTVVLLTNAGDSLNDTGSIRIVTTEEAFHNSLLEIKEEKPFHCPQCGDKFGRKSDMIRHLRIHTGLKPYNCHLCNRAFSRKEDMARHLLTHSGVKPYLCNICDKSFSRKTDFDMHNTVHAMEVCPLQCQVTLVDAVCET